MPPRRIGSRLHVLLFGLAASGGGALGASPQDRRADEARPNVILIVADDLGWGDLSAYGQTAWQTPRLDRMAAEGVRLTDFYVSVPYCAPSRAALLTGRHPFRSGVTRNPTPDAGLHRLGLDPEEVTIAEALRARSYATCCIGKWHLGHLPRYYPRRHGFDEYYGILYSNDMRPVFLAENELAVEYPVVQSFLTEKYTQRALDFIERHRDRPFFLYLPHAMPHKPLAAAEGFYTPETKEDLYADVLRELDASVGRILDALAAWELERRTLVIFTSDNGPWFGGSTGGLRGMKGSTFEGGIRVPLIARWPGRLPAGETRSAPAATIDLFPTIAGLAGVTALPRPLDGVDLMGLLAHGEAPAERALFAFDGRAVRSVRQGRWKLHVRPPRGRPEWARSSAPWIDPRGPDGTTLVAPFEQAQPAAYPGGPDGDAPRAGMLFDLESDRAEAHDVAAAHPDVVRDLAALARRLEEEIPPEDASPERGEALARGPRFVSPAAPLPIEAVLPPARLGDPAARRDDPAAQGGDLYTGLDSDRFLAEAVVVATVEDEEVFTEGPAVGPDGAVYFTNIPVSKILSWDPAAAKLTTFREGSNQTNGLLFDRAGRLLACEGGAGRITRTPLAGGAIEVIAAEYRGFPFAAPNDLCLDAEGRIYFTSRPGTTNPAQGNPNAVYRVDPGGAVTQLLAWPRVHMPNGIVIAPDGKTLYLIEAHPDAGHHRDIRAYDLAPDGTLGRERVLIDFYPGRSGDGMAIDREGNLYVAAGLHAERGTSETLDTRPGIHVISPEGRLLAFRETPEDTVTNCTFGGDDRRTLYVTAGTKLVAIRTAIPGAAP